MLNLTADLIPPAPPDPPTPPTPPLPVNQRNVAIAIDNFFNNGGALPPTFVSLFGLSGNNLVNALSQLSGEAATGAERVAFQLTDEFLNLMLDPFVDGRGGGPADWRSASRQTKRKTLPPDVALAYASVLKAPPKPSFDQRWTAWGAAYGGSDSTNGDPAVGSNNVHGAHFRLRRRYGLPRLARHHRRLRARRRRHQLGSCARPRQRAERCLPGSASTAPHGLGRPIVAGALASPTIGLPPTARRSAISFRQASTRQSVRRAGRSRLSLCGASRPSGSRPTVRLQAQEFSHSGVRRESDLTGDGFGLRPAAMNATDVAERAWARASMT